MQVAMLLIRMTFVAAVFSFLFHLPIAASTATGSSLSKATTAATPSRSAAVPDFNLPPLVPDQLNMEPPAARRLLVVPDLNEEYRPESR
jgi:hypothetical protein